ncbi:MAG: VWA domain-containing protein [Planctomycetes bacterium]|nr:VWA domain-containing protein [Planctomycetota bacterium]
MIVFADFTPFLAAGAATAAIGLPVLIHLLFRKRYQIVPWAAMRFLILAERRHRRRIDQWILLILRALALLLPLCAMIAATKWAEPLWQAIKPGATETITNIPRTHHVIVLDASLSMTTRTDDGQSRFEKAIAQAESLIRSGGAGDGYSVLVIPNDGQPLVPGPSNDIDKIIAELKSVKPTHAPADTASALGAIADIIARSPRAYPRRQVTFLTDMQRSAWANALPKTDTTAPDIWQRIVGRSDVVVVDVARSDLDNVAVTSVELTDPLPFVDSPGVVSAVVANFGRAEKRDVRVQLLLGRPSAGADSLVPVEQQTVKLIPAGGRTTVVFGAEGQVRFREKGIHVLQVKMLEPDELPADDSRALAVSVRDGIHAILIDGKPDPLPLRRATGYLARALFPPEAKPANTPARPRVMTPAEFADPTVGDLTGIDCVYVCDVPTPTADLAMKLDGVLKRGGGVVIGLGPNAAANRAMYNQVLFNEGNGILPGPLGEVVVSGPAAAGFRFAADEEEYAKPPLRFFQDEKIRGGLIMAPFRGYIRLDPPSDARTRRILSFVPATAPAVAPPGTIARKPDAAIAEWTRHRGRVVVYTSSFNEDWNDWPPLPSYLMFQQEFLRFVAASPDRHTVQVFDPIEEFYPPAAAGLTATLAGPDGISATLPLAMQDEAGVARFTATRLSGLYRLRLEGHSERVFAVNVPEGTASGGSESDLKRIDSAELRSIGPVQVVPDFNDAKASSESGAVLVSSPKPHGPMIARFVVMFALAVLALELFLAWRWGPARAVGAGSASGSARPVERKFYLRVLSTAAALVPLAFAITILGTLIHYERTGNLLGFLPPPARESVEVAAGVPAAQPGEGTKWRLDGFTAFVRNSLIDRRLVLALAAVVGVLTVVVYRLERRAVSGFHRLVVPGLLRLSVFLLALFVLLPQLRLAFDREGWPEVVILIDTSGSMGHFDEFKDPAVKAKAEELAKLHDLPAAPHRLALARILMTHKDGPWLERLLKEKEVKVHIYAVDSTTRVVSQLYEPEDISTADKALRELVWDDAKNDKKGGYRDLGNESRLGDGVEAVLKAFRGGSLAAIIMLTDGVTTAGDDLPKAAREAARAGVPLYFVGVGDAWEVPDLELTDLQADDTVTVGDRIVFDARLVARGQVPGNPVNVTLYEKGKSPDTGKRITVTPDPNGNRVPVTIAHTPTEAGEKTYVLEVQSVAGETDLTNNRLERTVLVTDSKRVRVLYIEGYPRYDFRFVKVLLERESERSVGGKGFSVEVLLLNSSVGWAGIDRSVFSGDFPTRDQLFGYDVVVLGDVNPKQLVRFPGAFQNFADFVKIKGGGLLFLSGEHGTPAAFADTPLADVLPVTTDANPRPAEDPALVEGYRPRITPAGRQHPLFRFSPDDVESAAIWNRLQPLYWAAKGYRRKPNTVVLAEHPDRPAEGGPAGANQPLVIQSFAGAGPVLFLGFDDTWRWRYRNDEEHFDRFWVQAVKVLSRSRVRRIELKVSPKVDFRRDEKMTVVVRFPVEAPAPPAGQPVRVALTRSPLPNSDGTPGAGQAETSTLTLARVPGPGVQYETVVTRTPEGEYRFILTDPETQGGISAPSAVARVLPPLNERDRVQLNKADLTSAAQVSNGGFYTLATANQLFDDLKNLQRVPLNQPCPPVELWNSPAVYLLIALLLSAEWLLRKRERLL